MTNEPPLIVRLVDQMHVFVQTERDKDFYENKCRRLLDIRMG